MRHGDYEHAGFTLPDLLAVAWFFSVWIGYSLVIENTAKGRSGLNALMDGYRDIWMEQLLGRELRMVDAQVTAALQNGTAFFASTSLIAIGGALTLLRSTEEILTVVATLPFGVATSRDLWELKMIGLAVIFVYAFFKFAWSYRLFNYFAIMVGAAPPPAAKDTAEAQAFAHRAARLCADAGRAFNRGQRAFFFALGYLGWFLGPLPLALTTAGVVVVMPGGGNSIRIARRAFDAKLADATIAGVGRRGGLSHPHQNGDDRDDQHRDAGGEHRNDALAPIGAETDAVGERQLWRAVAGTLRRSRANIGRHRWIPL